MSASNLPAYHEWLERGKKDLADAELLLREGGTLENVAFLIQQAVEKHLKGYLIARGWHLQKTHDLEILITEAATHDRSLVSFLVACRKISGYYFQSRYPLGINVSYSHNALAQSLSEAKDLITRVNQALVPPAAGGQFTP